MPRSARAAAVLAALTGGGLLIAACAVLDPERAGERVFVAQCAGCHGAEARGLPGRGPDLTGLAARQGGFPTDTVLARVEGYGLPLGARGGAMPLVGDRLAGRLVLLDRGDGRRVMVPRDLADAMAWLRSVQR